MDRWIDMVVPRLTRQLRMNRRAQEDFEMSEEEVMPKAVERAAPRRAAAAAAAAAASKKYQVDSEEESEVELMDEDSDGDWD